MVHNHKPNFAAGLIKIEMKFTIALSTVLLIANHAFGQLAGDLDLNFNGNGYVTHDFGFQDNASGVVMQADQKIIVTGTALSPSFMGTLKIMRLNQDGSIDSAFADNGVFSFSVTAETYGVESFVRDDGKIVVGGLAAYNYGYYDILLLRINADGSIDSTFGTNGYTIINYSTRDDLTQAITEQPDGKIVVSGTIMDTTVFKNIPTLLRFNEDGIIDSTFGNNGLMQFPVAEPDNELSSVMVQADGKILASGHYQNVFTGATDFDILMVRTDSSGMPDTAFGTNGMVTTSVNGGIDDAFGMAID